MNFTEYVRGLIVWALFSSLFLFWLIWFASAQADREYVIIGSWRLFLLLCAANAVLTAILVKVNR